MKPSTCLALAAAAALTLGCATSPSPADLDKAAADTMRSSFREQGIAKLDRIDQDAAQRACSSDKPLSEATARQIEAQQLATIEWPKDGKYLGDWREGEKIAQNGRGMTFTDPPDSPGGGGCYNCHQIAKAEISFGTIGPSLYNYGKNRGVTNLAAPTAQGVIEYTWMKIYNAKTSNACSNMPRFGHAGLLDPKQMADLMSLLLDPKSPVNQ